MNPTIKIVLDVISMAGTVICLNWASKTYKAWAWYLIPTIAFIILMWNANLPGQVLMGGVLFLTGVNNFRVGRRKACAKRK